MKLPSDFVNELEIEIGDVSLDTLIENYEFEGKKKCFVLNDDELLIKCWIWKEYLFDPSLNKIIKHTKQLLNKDVMKGCSYIYLVGGYTRTPYYQDRIGTTFGINSAYNINIIIPQDPTFCVVDGAARMGLLQNKNRVYVETRVLSQTYGELIMYEYNRINRDDYDEKYIENNTVVEGNVTYLDGCFKIFCRKGQSVGYNEKYEFFNYKIFPQQKYGLCQIYSSDECNPKTKDDVNELLFQYFIEFPDDPKCMRVSTEMLFGQTQISIESYYTQGTQKRQLCRKDIQYKK